MKISPAVPEHYSAILELNERSLPHVNSITEAELAELAAQAFYFKAALDEQTVAGFLLALPPGTSYGSLNYRWFSERYEQFYLCRSDRCICSLFAFGVR